MSTRTGPIKTTEQRTYITVCDQCGEDIPTDTPRLDEERIRLTWGLLDCWWGDDFPNLDGSADLCSIGCARAFLVRVEQMIADATAPAPPTPEEDRP